MRIKPLFAVLLPLAVLLLQTASVRDSHAQTPSGSAIELASSYEDGTVITARDPPELGGCNSRCRRVMCAESGTGRSYLCRCDCGK